MKRFYPDYNRLKEKLRPIASSYLDKVFEYIDHYKTLGYDPGYLNSAVNNAYLEVLKEELEIKRGVDNEV